MEPITVSMLSQLIYLSATTTNDLDIGTTNNSGATNQRDDDTNKV